jgi:hypothetical protein
MGGGGQGAAQLIFEVEKFFASQPLPLETADTQPPSPFLIFCLIFSITTPRNLRPHLNLSLSYFFMNRWLQDKYQ